MLILNLLILIKLRTIKIFIVQKISNNYKFNNFYKLNIDINFIIKNKDLTDFLKLIYL